MKDLLAAAAFTLLAAAVFVLTVPFPPGAEGSLSPASYPRLLAASLALLTGLLIVEGRRRKAISAAERTDVAAAVGVVGLTAVYLVAWHRWRFDVPTVLYVAALSRLSGPGRWGSALLFAALVTAFLSVAFGYVLRVPLDGI